MLYDIVPDIHGDIDRLHRTLASLGWSLHLGRWSGPQGRRLAFLGDFIDGGRFNAEVLHCVWSLVDQNCAVAVMGNHELNALHYHRKHDDGTWMRAHDDAPTRQHASFLETFGVGTRDALETTRRFLELPLWLDLGQLRIVHACWSDSAIDIISDRRPDGRLREEDLAEVALDESPFAKAVNETLKGPKRALPGGARFADHTGFLRRKARIKWWSDTAQNWRDAVVSVPNPAQVPDISITDEDKLPIYPRSAKPVFFGHYKLTPKAWAGSHNALCLDYPKTAFAFRQPENWGLDLRSGLAAA